MTRELFGPILPVIGSTNLDDVEPTMIAGRRPLARYPSPMISLWPNGL